MTRVHLTVLSVIFTVLSVMPPSLGAQASIGGVPADTGFMFPAAFVRYVLALPDTAARAFCVVTYTRARGIMDVDSLVPVEPASNPTCPPRQAVLLVRPECLFTIAEFLHLRYRALYVAIWAPQRRCALGLPLRDWPQADDVTQRVARSSP